MGFLTFLMENFPNLEVLLFNDLLKCGQTNGQVFAKGPLIYYGTGGSAKLLGVCKLEIVAWGVMKFYLEVGGGLSKVFDYELN